MVLNLVFNTAKSGVRNHLFYRFSKAEPPFNWFMWINVNVYPIIQYIFRKDLKCLLSGSTIPHYYHIFLNLFVMKHSIVYYNAILLVLSGTEKSIWQLAKYNKAPGLHTESHLLKHGNWSQKYSTAQLGAGRQVQQTFRLRMLGILTVSINRHELVLRVIVKETSNHLKHYDRTFNVKKQNKYCGYLS